MDFWEIENALFAEGYETVCGVDEAGRGPLAGPVLAAAVILPPGLCIPGLDDSKKLSEKKRERLFDEITDKAVAYGIAEASHSEIDELNIQNAVYLAMNRAIEKLSVTPDIAIIDGNRNAGITCRSVCAVGGDGRSASVAAASVLAKVSRDRLMVRLSEQYPQYGFEKHKGYPTPEHRAAVRKHGLSELHRLSYRVKW